ncbi:hypothetical protein [Georgenia sp. SYP-B2076]|uniref:hypothetical protein n=1 Tax=Georgenia sp. SYP-B2076 TaxID=2495881 RepID=UPI000F8C8744|nr:hypothetical protein [Georgenia sp. SYP-B2076]
MKALGPLRPARRLAAVGAGALAMASLGFVGLPADAASTTPGDFSSVVAPNPLAYTVDDCTVEVGIVYDWTPAPDYHHIGGVRVNCATTHSVIDATVALYYQDPSTSQWVQYGDGSYGVRYDSAGTGYAIPDSILRTTPYCVGELRGNYWMVGATVRTERTGGTVYSHAFTDPGAGC